MMKHIYMVLALVCISLSAPAQNFIVRELKTNLFIPWELIYGPDDNIWFTQKNGFICRLDPASGHTDTLYHETNTVVQGEGGMLGMALHPSFPTTPYVYVAYEYSQGGYKERIVRYSYFSNGDSLGNHTILLDNIPGANVHNGCRLAIANNKLFITTGDAADQTNAQDLSSINGKILRINLDGSIPSDNPIAGSAVWAWGDRNSQGLVYANGKLYTSMHGANSDDEINIIEEGRNYGWPNVQGDCNQGSEMTFCSDSNVVEPIYSWTPTIAVSGMEYYNHPMFPQWGNALAMASLKDESLYILKLNNSFDAVVNAIRIDTLDIGRIRDVAVSPQGSIFLSTSNSPSNGTGGKVDKIVELVDTSYVPVNVQMDAAGKLSVYPNPARDEIRISLKGQSISGMVYAIFNTMGQEVRKGIMQTGTISVNTLAPGLYQLSLSDERGQIYKAKILKE
jgi:glucose/arabinose dehydrogenase